MNGGGGADPVPTPASTQGDDGWTILKIIEWSGPYLTSKGIERGRLDAELLLADVLGVGRLDLYLQFDRPLTPDERGVYRERLRRRALREPLQYVVGHTAFRELELRTDPRVLIPRPETEQLVQTVLDWTENRVENDRPKKLIALDIGTGSGCIALSLALEGPLHVCATDRSEEALAVARENGTRAGVEGGVDYREGDLFEPVQGERYDVVVSNPPYVTTADHRSLEPEVRDWEPAEALVAGADGLEVIRRLVDEVADYLVVGGLLALEVGLGQAEVVADLIRRDGVFTELSVREDLSGRPRFVTAERS